MKPRTVTRKYQRNGRLTRIGLVAAATATAMADAPPDTEQRGAAWEGIATFLDTPTDEPQPRLIHADGVTFRSLPMPLMAMFEDDHGSMGGPVSVKVGRVDSAEIVGDQVKMAGTFDATPEGQRGEAWAGDGTARVSVDTMPIKWQVTAPADVVQEDEAEMQAWIDGDVPDVADLPVAQDGRVVVDEGATSDYVLEMLETEVMGLTMVPFSAFAESKIALVANGMLRVSFAASISTDVSMASVVYTLVPAEALQVEDYRVGDLVVTGDVSGVDYERAAQVGGELAASFGEATGRIIGTARLAATDDGIPVALLVDCREAGEIAVRLGDTLGAMGATWQSPIPHMVVAHAKDAAMALAIEDAASGLIGSTVVFTQLETVSGVTHQVDPLDGTPAGDGDVLTASAAGLAPVAPPAEWFHDPDLSEVTPVTVTPEGRVYGHVTGGTCHISYPGECVECPTDANYAYFSNGRVITAEGSEVWTGRLVLGTDHAALSGVTPGQARDHYADTGRCVADVVMGENGDGFPWIAGAIRPDASPEDVRALRASDVSPDWREINGQMAVVGLIAVNISGLPVPRPAAVVADGRLVAMVGRNPYNPAARLTDADVQLRVLAATATGGIDAVAGLAASG